MSVVVEAPHASAPATAKAPASVIALAVIAAVAPFDLALPPDGWTSIFIRPLMATVIVVSSLVIVDRRRLLRGGLTRLGPAIVLWLAVVWISAAVSDAPVVGAAGAIRLTAFALLIIATHAAVRTDADARVVLKGLAVGVLTASVLGLIVFGAGHEVLGTEHLVGRMSGQSRLTRPWSHPNVAGMAIAASLPAFWLFGRAWRIAAITVVIPVLTMTASRGAVIAALASAIAVVALVRNRPFARQLLAALAVGLIVAVASPGWTERFDRPTWDTTAISIEAPPEISIDGSATSLQLGVTNLGTTTWSADQMDLSARWVGAGQESIWGEHRWPLPTDISPGDSILMDVVMDASIPDGTFDVHWDLVADNGSRALRSNGLTMTSRGVVVDSAIDPLDIVPSRLQPRRAHLDRPEIWEMATREFLASPALGVGPSELGVAVAEELGDDRYFGGRHAHSLLLEPLATTGLLGTIPLFVILVGGLRRAALRARRDRVALVGMAGLTATLVHGLFDWPLVYTSAAIPIALLTGIAWAIPQGVPDREIPDIAASA